MSQEWCGQRQPHHHFKSGSDQIVLGDSVLLLPVSNHGDDTPDRHAKPVKRDSKAGPDHRSGTGLGTHGERHQNRDMGKEDGPAIGRPEFGPAAFPARVWRKPDNTGTPRGS